MIRSLRLGLCHKLTTSVIVTSSTSWQYHDSRPAHRPAPSFSAHNKTLQLNNRVSDVTLVALPSNWAEARAWKKIISHPRTFFSTLPTSGRMLNIITLILWGQFMIQTAEKSMLSIRIQSESEKVVKKWYEVTQFLVLHSIMMILWSDLKSEMKRPQFLCCMQWVLWNACLHCMDVCWKNLW